MTTEIIKNDQTQKGVLTKDNINALIQASVIPNGTPVSQIKIFAQICSERGISPFSKEVYLVEYGGKYSVIVGINGFRKIAAETGEYAGCDDVKFNVQPSGDYHTASTLINNKKLPTTATTTVYRIVQGIRVPFVHTAVFSEFNTGKQKWRSMPFQMIAKVSEAFALRKGFSDRLTGLNIAEEKGALTNTNTQQTPIDLSEIEKEIEACKSLKDLTKYYNNNHALHSDQKFMEKMTSQKIKIKNEL